MLNQYDEAQKSLTRLAPLMEAAIEAGDESAQRDLRNAMLTPRRIVDPDFHAQEMAAVVHEVDKGLPEKVADRQRHINEVIASHELVYGEYYDLNPEAFDALIQKGGCQQFAEMCKEYGTRWQSVYEVGRHSVKLAELTSTFDSRLSSNTNMTVFEDSLDKLLSNLTQHDGIQGYQWEPAWRNASSQDRIASGSEHRQAFLHSLGDVIQEMLQRRSVPLNQLKETARNFSAATWLS